ncbi:prepilin-type N-terminal cleavage/methylation domain-containing protein [Clostridium bovifaecis]|uniref:Prepilin-type N-terminal cleavage/methylation domain-containing protein n=1 Tax=Clostridium bovifaecis TaxID=2184719 RepID=A0A6I6F3E4_9CLOT|nr:prepilin-type N-terminal cleavage/methylation domain-containing protein [Clostridium bovifaecis]
MKKGFTLIELIIAMGVIAIMLTLQVNMLSRQASKYKNFIKSDREESYCREALRFIEGEIYDLNNKSIRVTGDTLVIKKANGDENTIREMRKFNGRLKIVITYNKVKNSSRVTDTIVEDIGDFQVKEKENLMFISINTLGGKEYERCFGIGKDKRAL